MSEKSDFASFNSRLSAWSIDSIIVGITGFFVTGFLFPDEAEMAQLTQPNSLPKYVVLATLGAIYYIGFTGYCGQTLGKMRGKIKVVNIDHSPVTYFQSIRRYTPYISAALLSVLIMVLSKETPIDLSMPSLLALAQNPAFLIKEFAVETLSVLWILASAITLLASKTHQTIHDYMADTIVVKTKSRYEQASSAY